MPDHFKRPQIESKYYDDFVKTLPDLSGKVIAITGTTSGTGFVAAKTLAKLGAKILLLNRASIRAETSHAKLKQDCSNGDLVFIECDLQKFSSVRKAAKEILLLCPDGLDVLCNNAGVMALRDQATGDGFDIQMQTNHLSHFLLCKELMPGLKKAAKVKGEARIVNHSSIARLGVRRLEEKYLEKNGGKLGGNGSRMIFFPQGRWTRYCQTKLANAAFTACLHEKLQTCGSKIKALLAHPGFALTELQNTTIKDGGMSRWFSEIISRSAQTKEDGSMGIIKAMASPEVQSGDFIGPGSGKMASKGPLVHFELEKLYDNQATKNLLWSKSCEAIGENFDIS